MSDAELSTTERPFTGLIIGGFAIGLTMWFWLDLWLGGGLIGGDIFTYYFPQKMVYADSLQRGRLLQWNMLVGQGYPVIGESQTAVYYPLNILLYRVLNLNTAYSINHILHYMLAFVGTVMLARALQLSLSASLLTATVFVYGWFPPRGCLEWAIITGGYFPVCLWMLIRFQTSGKLLWLWGLAGAVGLQLLAGHYHLAWITLLTLLGWQAGAWWWRALLLVETPAVSPARCTIALLGCLLLGVWLASAQLLPTWELKQASQRQTTSSADFVPCYGHYPWRYLSLLVAPWSWAATMPELNTQLNRPGWLVSSEATNPVEAHLYLGVLSVWLALGGGVVLLRNLHGRKPVDLQTRQLFCLGLIGLAGLIFATGWLMPVFGGLPGFSYFRGLGRYTLPTALALAMWAGYGWDAVRARLPKPASGIVFIALMLVSVVDLSWMSQRVTYSFMLPKTPLTRLEKSEIRQLLADQIPPTRLLAPGANLPTLTGVAATPVYLGIGPAEYFDPELTFPQAAPAAEDVPFGTRFTPEQLKWLRTAGVTHVLGFAPPENQNELELIWVGTDTLLNAAWGRPEPLFLSRLKSALGRAYWEADLSEIGTPVERQIRWQQYSAEEIRLEVTTPVSDRLILTDLYDSNWQLYVDEQPQPTERIAGMFRGVRIEPGRHQLQWIYRSWSVQVGKGLSIAGFTIWILLGATVLIFKKKS